MLRYPCRLKQPAAEADAYLASWRKLVQDRRITLAFDQRGQFSMTASGVPATGSGNDQTKDEVIQRLLSMIVPLPAEPVGAGARWRVVTILRQRPAYVKQTAIYTLSSAAVASKAGPATWKLHIKLTRVGEQQAIQDPLLPPGATADGETVPVT